MDNTTFDNLYKNSRKEYKKYLEDEYFKIHQALPFNIQMSSFSKDDFLDWFLNTQTTYRKLKENADIKYAYSVFRDNEKRLHMVPSTLGIIMESIFKPINKVDLYSSEYGYHYRPTISICSLRTNKKTGKLSSKSKNIKLCYHVQNESTAKYILYLARITYWNALLQESFKLDLINKNQLICLSKLKPRDKYGRPLIKLNKYLQQAIKIYKKYNMSMLIKNSVNNYSIARLQQIRDNIEPINLKYKKVVKGEELHDKRK